MAADGGKFYLSAAIFASRPGGLFQTIIISYNEL